MVATVVAAGAVHVEAAALALTVTVATTTAAAQTHVATAAEAEMFCDAGVGVPARSTGRGCDRSCGNDIDQRPIRLLLQVEGAVC